MTNVAPSIFPSRFPIEDLTADKDAEYNQYFESEHFGALAKLEDDGGYWPVYRRQVILDHVREHFAPGGSRLIDVGCGTGVVATYLNQHGFHVDYADAHLDALRLARLRAAERLDPTVGARRFIRIDVTRQQTPGEYDGALVLDVLEHLPDDRVVLAHVHEQLARYRPNPTIVFTVPAFQFLWSPWDDMHHHQRRYTLPEVTRLAEECGLEVVKATYFFAPLFVAAALVKAGRVVARSLTPAKPPATNADDLLEGKSHPLLTRAMLSVLSVERKWLRRRALPFGTSIICVARSRGK
jgi:2-polyprenyl-3-methyl-5-hydroxy-6-metoxy-1,4-benzoquinol methylase